MRESTLCVAGRYKEGPFFAGFLAVKPLSNEEVAEILGRIADLLAIEGANPFRIQAYRNAVMTVSDLNRELSEMIAKGEDLTELSGIGKDLATKLIQLVSTASLPLLREISRRTPVSLCELLRIPSLGPKRVRALHQRLKIKDLKGLEKAALAEKIEELPGFGEKTQAKIISELQRLNTRTSRGRMPLNDAVEIVLRLQDYLRSAPGVEQVTPAGSFRRRRETVGDLDFIATGKSEAALMEHFLRLPEIEEVVSRGPTRSSVRLKSGLNVDLRVVPEESYGAALHYFTGSKAHNVAVRTLGMKRGLKINEYGVYEGERRIGGRTEEEVFAAVGLPYIPPELRENNGEIESALQKAA